MPLSFWVTKIKTDTAGAWCNQPPPPFPSLIGLTSSNVYLSVRFYSDFLENCGVANEDREFGISEEDYYGGSFLIAFDRTIDGCNRYHRHEPETGAIDIVMTSSEATSETLTIKLYCTYSSDIVFARKKDDPKVVKVISYF